MPTVPANNAVVPGTRASRCPHALKNTRSTSWAPSVIVTVSISPRRFFMGRVAAVFTVATATTYMPTCSVPRSALCSR